MPEALFWPRPGSVPPPSTPDLVARDERAASVEATRAGIEAMRLARGHRTLIYCLQGRQGHHHPARVVHCAGRMHFAGHAVLPLCYRYVMAVRKKRSISIPPELDAEIAAAAEQAGMSYSAWLADTARKEFTIRAGLAAVSAFERDHGAFSAAEIADADDWAARAIQQAGQAGTDSGRRSA
jgi:hypothetical protein